MLKPLVNPDVYHGKKKKGTFFEGWYFKIVHPSLNKTFAFIPGIILSSTPSNSHSFIQVMNGTNSKLHYIKYETNAFKAETSKFQVQIDRNSFSLESMELDLEDRDISIKGKLNFNNTVRWPGTLLNPGSMGFYNYLTFMQCYSQVCSLDSTITGILEINGETIDFTGGNAYIEKNWGNDFPYSYIWVQCNNFHKEKAALTCSIAHIPLLFTSFTGFLIGFYHNDKLYEFTSINSSKLDLFENKHDVFITAYNKNFTLYINTKTSQSKYINLYAPREDKMIPIARETLGGGIKLFLKETKTGRVILSDCGMMAGVEFCGNYQELSNKKEKF